MVSGGPAAAPAALSPTAIIRALSPAVEASVESTRPLHWPMTRACLYYAIAGQALLARQGIAARLRVGQVVYSPGTAAAHPIAPHAWLETETYFVDYAALPRWGEVMVIPRDRVAAAPSELIPGVTQVLAITAGIDDALAHYLNHHYRHFYRRPIDRRLPAPIR
jgi:hypothetical protein